MTTEDVIRRKFEALAPLLDERGKRCWAGIGAEMLGDDGIAMVVRATGMSRTTIRAGRDELRAGIENVDVVQKCAEPVVVGPGSKNSTLG